MANTPTRKPSRTAGKTRNPRRQGPVTQDRKAAHSAQEALPGRQPAPAASATALTTAPAGHDGTAAPVSDETAAAAVIATGAPAAGTTAVATPAAETPTTVPAPKACVLSATAVGEQHLRSLPPVPCQDAVDVQQLPRPALARKAGDKPSQRLHARAVAGRWRLPGTRADRSGGGHHPGSDRSHRPGARAPAHGGHMPER